MLPDRALLLANTLVRLLLEQLIAGGRSYARLRADVLALRHQLRMLKAIADRHESDLNALALRHFDSLAGSPPTYAGTLCASPRVGGKSLRRPRGGRPDDRTSFGLLVITLASVLRSRRPVPLLVRPVGSGGRIGGHEVCRSVAGLDPC